LSATSRYALAEIEEIPVAVVALPSGFQIDPAAIRAAAAASCPERTGGRAARVASPAI
jgi:hypothetical protein